MSRAPIALIVACLATCQLSSAVAQVQPAPQNDTDDVAVAAVTYADIVRADQPAAYWRFEDDQGAAELNGSPWAPQEVSGNVKLLTAGPRQQKFPLFSRENHAALFEKPTLL